METFDVIIIGSGLTGALAAEHHSRKGRKVCVVERGGDYMPDRKNHWSEAHQQVEDTNRWVTVARDDPFERTEIVASPDNPSFKYNMKFGVGGSGAVWSGAAFRFMPNDFRLKSAYGLGNDWPLSYTDLEPWYDKAEQELGVAGIDPRNLWPGRSPFPMPHFRQTYLDLVFQKHLGSQLPLTPIPVAVASRKYQGRGPCLGMRTCVAFCPTEARYASHQTHLRMALQRSNCTLYKRTMVLGLQMNHENRRIESIDVFSEQEGRKQIKGRLFILAANTVENTRLLLLSANKVFPRGLANSSGLLGKYFHSTGAVVWFLRFPEKTYPGRGRPITSACLEYADGPHRREMPSFIIEVWNDVWAKGGLLHYVRSQVEQGHWGTTLKKRLEDYLSTIIITSPFEMLPRKEHSISLDREHFDSFGLPLPQNNLTWSEHEYKVRPFIEKLIKEHGQKVDLQLQGFGINGNHPYGTYRMSDEPSQGVVDSSLKSHDHENLYIFGGGSFVTGTCFNPTLTMAALTLKSLASMRSEPS